MTLPVILLAIGGGAGVFVGCFIMWYALRRGIREELRAWKLRRKFRPAKQKSKYHIVNVSEPE